MAKLGKFLNSRSISIFLFGASHIASASSSSTNSSHTSATISSASSASVLLPSSTKPSIDSTFTIGSFASTPVPQEPEYSFTYPPPSSWVDTLVNYKDTIELYWTLTYPFNDPAVSIHCWYRNATANDSSGNPLNLRRSPDLIQNIGPITPYSRYHVVNMTEYKVYNPCQFFLVDSVNVSLTGGVVASAGLEILIDDKASAKDWTVESEAPVSTAWPTNGAEKAIGGGRVLGLAASWGLVLTAFGMSMM